MADTFRLTERAQVADRRARERALAGTGSTRQADRVAGPTERIRETPDLAGRLAAALDDREQSGDGSSIAAERSVEQLGNG